MNNPNKPKTSKKQTQGQANVGTSAGDHQPKAKAIKLGIDVHLSRYVVVRILDGGTPQD